MGRKALLINYNFCSGCHSCEIACRVEHGYPDDQGGVIVKQIGPWEYETDKFQYDFMPVLTDQCDQCAERLEAGKDPTCVHHCQARVMEYGEAGELLAAAVEDSRSVIYLF